MNATTSKINDAITRSITHDEIVHLTIDGDSGDALEAIAEVSDDYDWTLSDYEGEDRLDVWATEGDDWRLCVSFAE